MKKITTFGKRLKQYRTENELTLDALEKIIHVPAQTLNRYELEQRVPKIDAAVSIASSLSISPLWLQGFDVPLTSWNDTISISADSDIDDCRAHEILDGQEQQLIDTYRVLNEEGQAKLLDYAEDLKGNCKYKKSDLPCVDQKTS